MTAPPPVHRGLLHRGSTLSVHDNVCGRIDPSVSPETRPLEFFEVVFPRSGVWVRHRGREALAVDAGRAHLFAKGESHRVSHPGECGDRNTGIVLGEAAVLEVDPLGVERGGFSVPSVAVDERRYAEHCALLEAARGGADALEVEERALSLAAAVLAAARGERSRAARSTRVHRDLAHAARGVLAARFRDRLALDELAASLDVSVFHLCRVFRAEFGETMHRFRRSLRVRAALRRLTDPSCSLHDAAAAAGFSDRTQLHRAFRGTLGESPTAARRRLGPSKKRHARRRGAP